MTLTATIKIEFSTEDKQKADDVLEAVVQHIELISPYVEDVYVEEPPIPE